jgi:hypothetical protein
MAHVLVIVVAAVVLAVGAVLLGELLEELSR